MPSPSSQPAGITAGPDGALWFTEEAANKIGRITTGGNITEYPIPTNPSAPAEIAAGPDGALWFTEFAANPPKIGRLTTAGVFTEYPLAPGSAPDGITAGPDGAMWFTENGANKIGRITTDGVITEYPLPTGFRPGDITPGPDGRLWFTESEANRIGAISTAGNISEYALAIGSDPSGITAAAGALWFAEFGTNQIGRISTSGVVTEFGPTGSGPSGITLGSDGALWFTETAANKIGRMTTGGALTDEFSIPTPGSEPSEITAGPDGALWFTESLGNKIGRITTDLSPGPFTGYARPKGATPLRVPLVPAYDRCIAQNRTHGPPLASPSCAPPSQSSLSATVGSPDANGYTVQSTGWFSATVRVGDPSTTPDEADVRLALAVTDVRRRFEEATDYTGELQGAVALRITDRSNGTAVNEAATMRDIPLLFDFYCAATGEPSIGGACSTSTTADALAPGTVREGKRAIWEIGQVRVFDGGEDGFVQTEADNTLFLKQGVFVP